MKKEFSIMKKGKTIFAVLSLFFLLMGRSAEGAEDAIRLGVMAFVSKADGVSSQQA